MWTLSVSVADLLDSVTLDNSCDPFEAPSRLDGTETFQICAVIGFALISFSKEYFQVLLQPVLVVFEGQDFTGNQPFEKSMVYALA